MKNRRITSFLLCISFALTAATGILFVPFIRFVVGITNESMWRMVHFYSTCALVGLIIEHVLLNRKALWNYLKAARILGVFSYSMTTVVLVGVVYFGIRGPDLGVVAPWYEAELYFASSAQRPTLIAFPRDFSDGKADGWRLGKGWEVQLEGDDHVLSGSSEEWSYAIPRVNGWFNYTLESRVKLIKGKFHINFMTSEIPYRSKYFLGMGDKEFYLNREIEGEYPNLTGCPPVLELNEWYRIKIVLDGTNIKAYIDDELKLDYTDTDLPFIFGGFSFDVAPDSRSFWMI